MKITDDEVVKAQYYTNLLLSATKLVDKNIDKPFIIASNCISLVAGLTFHLLKNYHYDYKVSYYQDSLVVIPENTKQFIIVNPSELEKLNNVTLYFYYEGNEPGILCVK